MSVTGKVPSTAGRPKSGRTTERMRRRLGTRLVLAALVAVPAAVAVGLLAVAVESEWNPFRSLDQRTAARLHDQAIAHPGWTHAMTLVSDIGGPTVFRSLVGVLVVAMWARGARRLAVWAAVTMIVGAVIDVVLKAAVNRTRPSLPNPVAHAPGASFPSGHAFTATLGCGIIALAILPLMGRRWRWTAWTAAFLIAAAVGYSRVALGVHWVTDVVGGWVLGVGLIAATVSVFETWRTEHGLRPVKPVTEGAAPEESTRAAAPATGAPAQRDSQRPE